MKMTDLADALSPNIKTHSIGIRPGEKLHECMLTSDESLGTFELEDRYINVPVLMEEWKGEYPSKKLQTRINYSSETNTDWVSPEQFELMLEI
jgi:UDP-N-acetylglucosamine 4,6-dehydratase/5-epimerase